MGNSGDFLPWLKRLFGQGGKNCRCDPVLSNSVKDALAQYQPHSGQSRNGRTGDLADGSVQRADICRSPKSPHRASAAHFITGHPCGNHLERPLCRAAIAYSPLYLNYGFIPALLKLFSLMCVNARTVVDEWRDNSNKHDKLSWHQLKRF